jgi:ABC-type transport system involved in multi-copper enzyme maturation permease subunit
MADTEATTTNRLKARIDPGFWLRRNPVMLKELRARMRGNRAFALLTAYLGALALLVILVYLIFLSSDAPMSSVNDRRMLGKAIFGIILGIELMAVIFIAPGLTAGAISSEKERQTFDLLRTTLLPASSLVLGKFAAALLFLFLLLFAALPVQSLAFLFGGVAVEEVLIGVLVLVVTAVAFSAAGMLFSSFLARPLTSTVLAYGFAILLVFGLPFIFLVFSGLLGMAFSGVGSRLSNTAEMLLLLGGWLLVSFNPLSTAVATELILTEQQSAFTFTLPLSRGAAVTLPSPWIVYSLVHLLLSLVMIWASIRLVRRVEK